MITNINYQQGVGRNYMTNCQAQPVLEDQKSCQQKPLIR